MVGSSATLSIAVAVIGVLGTIIPPYLSVISQDYRQPNIRIIDATDRSAIQNRTSPFPTNLTQYDFRIANTGSAPATNLSVILNVSPMDIVNISNKLSTTGIVLPEFNNRVFHSGDNQTVNSSLLELHIPKLIHGRGSTVALNTFINHSDEGNNDIEAFAVYDQGSTVDLLSSTAEPISFEGQFSNLLEVYGPYYYLILYGSIGWFSASYILRRRKLKRFPLKIAKEIIAIRRELRNDHSSRYTYPEIWNQVPYKMRKSIDSVNDYLLIDDFNSELKKRNSYLRDINKGETLPKDYTLLKLNETLLLAAENVLDKIDWNKYGSLGSMGEERLNKNDEDFIPLY